MNNLTVLSPPDPMTRGLWNPPTIEDIRNLDPKNLPCFAQYRKDVPENGLLEPGYEFVAVFEGTTLRSIRELAESLYVKDPSVSFGTTQDGYVVAYNKLPTE